MAASSGGGISGSGGGGGSSTPASGSVQMGRSSSIMSLVDGPGKKPVIRRDDIEKRQRGEATEHEERSQRKEEKRESRESKQQDDKREKRQPSKQSEKREESHSASSSHEDVLAELEKDFSPKEKREAHEESEAQGEGEGDKKESRGDRRFQQLTDRLKQAGEREQNLTRQLQQRDQQYRSAFGEMQQTMQQMREQNIELKTHMEHLLRGSKGTEQEQDPISQLKEKMGLSSIEQENKALKERLEKFEQSTAQKEQEAEIKRKQGVLSGAAEQAVREHFLNGFSEEDSGRLGRRAKTLALALSYGRNIHPADAAKQLRQFVGEASLALFKSKSAALKARQDQSRDVSPPSPNGRSNPGAQGNGTPGWKDMKELDPKAKDPLDGMFRREDRRLVRAR